MARRTYDNWLLSIARPRRPHGARPRRARLGLRFGEQLFVEQLEDRCLLSASSWTLATSAPPDPRYFADTLGTSSAIPPTPPSLADTFKLHSKPDSQNIIFLDFDGHFTRDTNWNDDPDDDEDVPIPNIVTPPYSMDADGTFNNAELQAIQTIWRNVVEDFLPFDVDVTTEDPGTEVIAAQGIRVIIGGGTNDWFNPPRGAVGGVAFLGSFAGGKDIGCFVFSGDAAGDPKFTWEAISHETGHTLGLSHDGQVIPGNDTPLTYYPGHGPGLGFPTGWAPIMGVAYGQELSQWSKGEYPNAVTVGSDPPSNEDDLDIITKIIPYREDDHGNDMASATPLNYTGTTFSGEGIIEQNTDLDYFEFIIGIEEVTFDIEPYVPAPNLDILATLYDSDGNVVATSNPRDALNAGFSINTSDPGALLLQPGTYYMSIDGTGKPYTTDAGYSDYGSLGYFSIAGTRRSLLDLLIGVDFDVPGGATPPNWTLYSGGSGPAVLSDLRNENGTATPYNLSISSSGGSIASHSSMVDSSTIPFHPEPLMNLGGFISNAGDTWTFTWSDLEPLAVYEVYVFGLSDAVGGNSVEIIGNQTITFQQTLSQDDLVVNAQTGAVNRTLVDFAKVVPASVSGRITITVTTADGAPAAALGGLAIRPATLGSIHGQKWNDLDGNGVKDQGEPGLGGWTIFVDQNDNGELDATFTQMIPSVDVPQIIDDDENISVKSELFFEGVDSVFDVNVTLDISHTFDADLNVYLISPLGTRVELFTDVGGFEDNFHNTTLDDEASTPITAGRAPFTGSFRPEGMLSAFDGEDPVGVWTLEITDDARADTGVLNSWSLTITGREMSTVTDSAGNYTFDALPAGLYNVREVLKPGWAQTLGQPPVTVSSGARVTGVDFGNRMAINQPTPGSISGQKWNDLNGNGTKESGEPGLPGWIIYIDGNDNGVLDSTAEKTADSTDVPKPIADLSTVTSRIVFSGLSSISDVNVTLDITHSFDGDVDAYLISPAGTQVELFTGVGGQFNNFTGTTIDDQAATWIIDGSAPFTGSFRPEGLLSDFNGENPNGAWTLLIRDTTDSDVGTLNSWSLTITGAERSTTTDSDGHYTFPGLVPGSYVLREVQQAGWRQTLAPKSPITVALSQLVIDADFGNMVQVALPGDYNGDDAVDVVDFLVWRKAMNQSVPPFSGADGDGDGVISQADYDVWRANFGMAMSAPGTGATAALLEVAPAGGSGASASFALTLGEESTQEDSSGSEQSTSAPGQAERHPNLVAETPPSTHQRDHMRAKPRPVMAAMSNDVALMAWLSAQHADVPAEAPADPASFEHSPSGENLSEQSGTLDIVFERLGRLAAR